MMSSDQVSSSSSTQPEVPITPEHARQRASAVMMAIGFTQLVPLILAMVPLQVIADLKSRREWLVAAAIAGAIYVFTAVPVRFGSRSAAWLALAAAASQAMVFAALAAFSVVAAVSASSPGSMTMGVLLFGSVASLHLFVARWIGSALWSRTR